LENLSGVSLSTRLDFLGTFGGLILTLLAAGLALTTTSVAVVYAFFGRV